MSDLRARAAMQPIELERIFGRVERAAIGLGAIGVLASILAAFLNYETFIQGYLVGFLYWFSMPIGAMVLVMIHHLVGGRWGGVLRRPLEAAGMSIPLFALFFIPIALSIPELFAWARPQVVAIHPELQHKSAYLNIPFFLARAAGYFIVWTLLAWMLRRRSLRESSPGMGPEHLKAHRRELRGLQRLASLGLVFVAFCDSFALLDWMQSLEPLWFSSEYPFMIAMGQLLSATAFFTLGVIMLSRARPLAEFLSAQVLNDLGNILLVFVAMWAFTECMQFIIIWSGDTHERISWFVARGQGGWGWVIAALVVFQFFVPFFLLFSRKFKRHKSAMSGLLIWILAMRFLDFYWLVIPAFYDERFVFIWPALASLLGVGGIWVWVFCRLMRRAPIISERSRELFAWWRAGAGQGGHA